MKTLIASLALIAVIAPVAAEADSLNGGHQTVIEQSLGIRHDDMTATQPNNIGLQAQVGTSSSLLRDDMGGPSTPTLKGSNEAALQVNKIYNYNNDTGVILDQSGTVANGSAPSKSVEANSGFSGYMTPGVE